MRLWLFITNKILRQIDTLSMFVTCFYSWEEELKLTRQAIASVNRMRPRPRFFVVCGDLVDALPGNRYLQRECLLTSPSELSFDNRPAAPLWIVMKAYRANYTTATNIELNWIWKIFIAPNYICANTQILRLEKPHQHQTKKSDKNNVLLPSLQTWRIKCKGANEITWKYKNELPASMLQMFWQSRISNK